jgi:hypothetical protein
MTNMTSVNLADLGVKRSVGTTALQPLVPFWPLEHVSSINFENPLYFWRMWRKQKTFQENSENWENQVFIYWNDIFFGGSDLMHVMQSGKPY